jgi:membrane protease YdiL (CAAX protease family)
MLLVIGLTAVTLDKEALAPKAGAKPTDMSAQPAPLRHAFAWSFPAGYLSGLVFSLVVLRVVLGRTWDQDIGLRRLPLYHLLLGMLALPGFIIVSDFFAQGIHPLDSEIEQALGIPPLGDLGAALKALLEDFHWTFAVLAIGMGPGIVEELWCRGFLGRGLIGRYGWFPGIALSSMFFGLLHLWPPSYVIVTATMGAGLHFAYISSRSLWVPMAIHAANNSFAALSVLNVVPAERMDAAVKVQPIPIGVAAGCLLLFCGLAMWHSRWTWPDERRGEITPPAGSGVEMTAAKADTIFTVMAVGFCATLIWLLL